MWTSHFSLHKPVSATTTTTTTTTKSCYSFLFAAHRFMFTFCHAKSVLYKNTLDFVSFFNLWLEAKLISSWSFVSRNEESIPETKVEEPGGEGICVLWEIDVSFFWGGHSEHVHFHGFAYDLPLVAWLVFTSRTLQKPHINGIGRSFLASGPTLPAGSGRQERQRRQRLEGQVSVGEDQGPSGHLHKMTLNLKVTDARN